eukprot:gnl/Carplike_NY0171/2108_a2834_397.p1 GENE.gnl/Carplike_NY0171/2108_a2834_397~~gnl/Carplike_NY0171/2108_a2834_397.p1  ORF type:complete len:1139 (+),score=186.77 gnl/Carplike_NY0171/2108_a2834_397:2756-6172(+)
MGSQLKGIAKSQVWTAIKETINLSQLNERIKQKTARKRLRNDRFRLESLEPRLLLSADPIFTATAAADLSVRFNDAGTIVEIVDNTIDPTAAGNPNPVIASYALDDINSVTIQGQDGSAESLTIADEILNNTDGLVVNFFGGYGADDSIIAGDGSTNWEIVSSGKGNVGSVYFSGVEKLDAAVGDTLDYSAYDSGVTVDLSAEQASGFSQVTGFRHVTGSNYDDSLSGDASANTLSGGQGNDIVTITAGGDALSGGEGFDTLLGTLQGASVSSFDDVYVASAGADLTVRIDPSDAGNIQIIDNSITPDPAASPAVTDVVAEFDLARIDGLLIKGADGSDETLVIDTSILNHASGLVVSFVAGTGQNKLKAGNGSTTWSMKSNGSGQVGNVVFDGVENLEASAGDTLDYSAYGRGVDVDLLAGTATGLTSFSGFSNVTGSQYGDQLTGDASQNIIIAGDGDDVITATAGTDSIDGGAGFDSIDSNLQGSVLTSVETIRFTGLDSSSGSSIPSFIIVSNGGIATVYSSLERDQFVVDYDSGDTQTLKITNGFNGYSQTVDLNAVTSLAFQTGAGSDSITFTAQNIALASLSVAFQDTLTVDSNITTTGHLQLSSAKSIVISDGVTLDVDGDITLHVESEISESLISVLEDALNPFTDDVQADASIVIGAAIFNARNINVTSSANSSKYIDFEIDNVLLDAAVNGAVLATLDVGSTLPPASYDPENTSIEFAAGATHSAVSSADGLVDFEFIEVAGADDEIHITTAGETWSNVVAGDYIRFSENSLNGGPYKVKSVSADGKTLYIDKEQGLADQVVTAAEAVRLEGATITRSITQSDWDKDGFEVGHIIKVVGADSANDGAEFTIVAVTDEVITLLPTDAVADESTTADDVVIKQMYATYTEAAMPLLARGPDGALIDMSAQAADVGGDLVSSDLEGLLAGAIDKSGVLDIAMPVEFLSSKATSQIDIEGATFNASGDIDVKSSALSYAVLNSPGMIIGAVFVDSDSKSYINVKVGSALNADGAITIESDSFNTMNATSAVGKLGLVGNAVANKFLKIPGPSLAVAYGEAASESKIDLAETSSLAAGTFVTVDSGVENNFTVSAGAAAGKGGGAAGLAISDYTSNSILNVAGSITGIPKKR